MDACAQVEERETPPVGIALSCPRGPFFLRSPESAERLDRVVGVWAEATAAVARLSAPTVAAVLGDAVGPAWELALACDLRVVAADARVGSPEVRWGRMPGSGGTQRLVRAVGQAAALRLLLLGEVLTGTEAYELGLVHRLAQHAEFDNTFEMLLDESRAGAPIALAYAREAALGAADLSLAAGLRLEADLAALLQTTVDRQEGIASFLERRSAAFEGR
ncbi:MAG: enoyl-CoA hydratase/isomerase family protein [Chloroflexi bacterium]|nr:enoyl-CoA hydratase/isomerase family protein [Chloroflexota bacterium]